MKKIIVLITVIIILTGAVGFILLKQQKATVQTDVVSEGSSYVASSTEADTFPNSEVTSPSNAPSQQRVTRDFLFDQEVTQDAYNPGHFFLGNTYIQEIEPAYVITYEQQLDLFNIVLLTEPLKDGRLEAENYLRALLNISNPELCALRYTVSAPLYVSTEMSGIDLKFSFCPGAVPLQ